MARMGTDKGPCSKCGKSDPGLYWREVPRTYDFEDGRPPMETPAVGPVRCDACERRFRRAEAEAKGWGSLYGPA